MDMARIKGNLCPHCSGKGFHWKSGTIVSRVDGSVVATTYKQGPNCDTCDGTGQLFYRLSVFGWLIVAALGLAALAFIASPIFHLLT